MVQGVGRVFHKYGSMHACQIAGKVGPHLCEEHACHLVLLRYAISGSFCKCVVVNEASSGLDFDFGHLSPVVDMLSSNGRRDKADRR